MDAGRVSANCDARNIPHMQLFHHLKQKFPDLRDNDVNESIHKYGLDRVRCEEELSQRTQVHPGGYYGPWGRSSPAASRLTSPVRASTPTTTTTGEYLVYPPGTAPPPFITSPLSGGGGGGSPAVLSSPAGSPVGFGWHPGVANGYRPAPRLPQDGPRLGDIPQGSRDAKSRSRSVTPTSAPVVPNSHHPLRGEVPQRPERRRSAESYTETEVRQELEARLEALRLSPHPSEALRLSPHPTEPLRLIPNPTEPLRLSPHPTEPLRLTPHPSEALRLSPHPTGHTNMEPPAGLAVTATATTTIITTTSPALTTTTATTTITTTSTTINCTDLCPVDGGSNSSSSSSSSSRSSGRPPPGLLQDQLARKERLAMELTHQVDEKGRLEAEVEMMVRELQAKEHQRKLNADTNTLRIEEVQQENQKLQSECYEMENRILRLAPDFELDTYSTTLTSQQVAFSPEGTPVQPPPPQLTRGSSGSSLGSELGTPNTPNTPHTPVYLPTRPAPPPPAPPPPPVPNHTYGQYQGQGGRVAGMERVDEGSHKWGCSKCTFINHPDMNMCEMCDFPRFTIGTASSQPATSYTNQQGPCYCHQRHHHHHTTSAPPTGRPRVDSPSSYSSCPSLSPSQPKPSLTNMIKDKLLSLRDRRSDSV